MINRPRNWDSVEARSEREILPADGYVCLIKQATIEKASNGSDYIKISFDICEGEYKGFYQRDFQRQPVDDSKWRGNMRVFIPKDDGSELDEGTKSRFKAFTTTMEKSNEHYVWNWDERTLIGKYVGIVFRNEEWEFNGKTGWKAQPCFMRTVDSIRNGAFNIPAPRSLASRPPRQQPAPSVSDYSVSGGFVPYEDDGELPF